MKQTAVEWLEKQLDIVDAYKIKVKTIIEYAKEMEKQQIIDAYVEGDVNGIMDNQTRAEQYYKKTYKKDNETNTQV